MFWDLFFNVHYGKTVCLIRVEKLKQLEWEQTETLSSQDNKLASSLPMPETWFQAMSMARWAILGPTPGRRIRPSTVSGMSPPNSCWIRAVACLMYFTFVWEDACEFLTLEIVCSNYIYTCIWTLVCHLPSRSPLGRWVCPESPRPCWVWRPRWGHAHVISA